MLNANNEVNIKKEERKHSWSTVFAWLYLKTIGRILPKRWNRWAENILYYDKTTANNEVQTDAFKTVDKSVQVDLKPEVVEKESQSVVISKDEEVQTDGVAFQDTAMQTECVEKMDKNIEADLKPEVAEKDGEITSEDEGICSEVSGGPTDEDCSDIEVDRELTDDNHHDIEEIYIEDDELQTITLNKSVSEESEQLKLQLAEYEEDYTELKNVSDQIEKEFSDELEELRNEIEKNSVEIKKKDAKINILTALNEALKQDMKEIETRSNEQQQIAEIYMKLNELFSNVIEISEKTLQLNNQEQQEEKKSLENKVLELQKQAQALEGNRKWELAGIDGTLKETFLTIMEMLEKGLYAAEGGNESLKRQLTAQSVEIEELNKQLEKVNEEQKALTLSYDGQADQMEELQLENDFLEEQNRELRSRSRELESEVARLKEESIQSKVELASGIVKAFKGSEKKCMKTDSLTLLDEGLSASVEKLSDQLYKVKSMERQQPQSTQGSQQQLEEETIDLEGKIKDLNSQLDAVEKEKKDLKNKVSELQKQAQTSEGSKENVQKKFTDVSNQKGVELEKSKKNAKTLETALSNQKKEWEADSRKKAEEVERLKTLKKKSDEELRETKRKLAEQERLVGQLQANIKKLKEESQLDEKVGAVSLDSKYNEKYIKSYTDSLPLEDKVKTKHTPNSFMSHTNNTQHVLSLGNVRTGS